MPLDDFLVTYPCYILLREDGDLGYFVIQGGKCLCLFTDEDVLDTFHQARHGAKAADFEALVFDRPDQLVGALRCFEAQLARQQVIQIAIDPTPGKRVSCVPMRDFIAHLERTGEQ
jgi:hypothetical protein